MKLIRTKIDRTAVGSMFVLLAVCFWGASAPLAKYLIITKFSTLMVVQTRTLISFLILSIWFFVSKRHFIRIEKNDLIHFGLLGILGLALTNFFYYFTIAESTVATAILLQYTAPIWVVVYTGFLKKLERVTHFHVMSLLIALVGCTLAVTNGSLHNIQLKGWALLTGPLAALTYAFQIVLTKRLLAKYSLWTTLIAMFGFASIFWLIVHPPWAILREGYTLSDWGVFTLFALLSILIPQTAFAKGLTYLGASTAGIITTFEPIVAIGLAFVFLGESIGMVQALGGIMVLGALCILHCSSSIVQ